MCDDRRHLAVVTHHDQLRIRLERQRGHGRLGQTLIISNPRGEDQAITGAESGEGQHILEVAVHLRQIDTSR
jgi:hypothetical protein